MATTTTRYDMTNLDYKKNGTRVYSFTNYFYICIKMPNLIVTNKKAPL